MHVCLKIDFALPGTSSLPPMPPHTGSKVASASKGYQENPGKKANPLGTRIIGAGGLDGPFDVQVAVQLRGYIQSCSAGDPQSGHEPGVPKADFLCARCGR